MSSQSVLSSVRLDRNWPKPNLARFASPYAGTLAINEGARKAQRINLESWTPMSATAQKLPASLSFVIEDRTTNPDRKRTSLEETFADKAIVYPLVNFSMASHRGHTIIEDYLSPNETSPVLAREHLELVKEPGLLVSTGTERSFFDLSLFDPKICRGLVVRDINPKVKAYVDFNIFLLRVSKDREEYIGLVKYTEQLSEFNNDTFKRFYDKLDADSTLSNAMKNYYSSNILHLAKVFSIEKKWKSDLRNFRGVDYYNEDSLFKIVQEHAQLGNIIATIGDISDLRFLKGHPIALIDVSNIPDYSPLDFQGIRIFPFPRIVWTEAMDMLETFHSFIPTLLNSKERKAFDRFLEEFIESGTWPRSKIAQSIYGIHALKLISRREGKRINLPVGYFKEWFEFLRDYKTKNLLVVPGIGRVDLCDRGEKLNKASVEALRALRNHPLVVANLQNILSKWMDFDREKLLALSGGPGWGEASKKLQEEDPDFQAAFFHGNPTN